MIEPRRYIHIPKWGEFQNKDVWKKSKGHPPWIKLYTKLLHDEDYLALSHAQRSTLHGLWLMYASVGRGLRDDTASVSRALGVRVSRATLEALNHAGFIEFSSQLYRESIAHRGEERRGDKSEENYNNISHEIKNGLVRQRLVQTIGPMDESALTSITQLCERLPEGAVAKVTESIKTNRPRNRVAYALGALRSEAAA